MYLFSFFLCSFWSITWVDLHPISLICFWSSMLIFQWREQFFSQKGITGKNVSCNYLVFMGRISLHASRCSFILLDGPIILIILLLIYIFGWKETIDIHYCETLFLYLDSSGFRLVLQSVTGGDNWHKRSGKTILSIWHFWEDRLENYYCIDYSHQYLRRKWL